MNGVGNSSRPRIGIPVGAAPSWSAGGSAYLSYAEAISSAGGAPVAAGLRGERSVASLDGLLVPGGWDVHPSSYDRLPGDEGLSESEIVSKYSITTERERDDAEFPLIRQAIDAGKPLLAICRGIQSLNVVLARRLIPDIPTCVSNALEHASHSTNGVSNSHNVTLQPGSLLEKLYGSTEIVVNTRHHQGMTADMVAESLKVTAIASDGVVEAVESVTSSFVVGVQWHPERQVDDYIWRPSRRLFEVFVAACGGIEWS